MVTPSLPVPVGSLKVTAPADVAEVANEAAVTAPDATSDVPVAAPMFGVVSAGEVAKTARPVPVSSESAAASPAELVSVPCLAFSCV